MSRSGPYFFHGSIAIRAPVHKVLGQGGGANEVKVPTITTATALAHLEIPHRSAGFPTVDSVEAIEVLDHFTFHNSALRVG